LRCCTTFLYNLDMKTVTAAYAKANLPELLKRVQRGERVTISRYNKPVAQMVPPPPEERPVPKFGTGKGKVKIVNPNWAKPMTDEEVDAFMEGR
jgi:prevent-host-death family protein